MANLESIVQQLKQQRDRLDAAISALNSVNGSKPPATKRRMSTAARRKISLAQKARWAKQKSAPAEAAAPKRKMSAASRRKIAAAQRARWAKMKKAA